MIQDIKAVIFDWAGTMVDFGCMAPVEAMVAAFAANGLAVTEDQVRRDMGRAKRDHVMAILAEPMVAAQVRAARGHAPGPAEINAIFASLEPLMTRAAEACAALIPGAAETVAALRAAGVKIGSGTGYTPGMMAGILPRARAQGYAPDCVVCSGDTKSGRPAPLMTWKALVDLDAWPARHCVKVDDAPVGITEGREAGCWTIGIAASGNEVGLSEAAFHALDPAIQAQRVEAAAASLRAAGADFVIDTVADLMPVLEAIAGRIASGVMPRGPAA